MKRGREVGGKSFGLKEHLQGTPTLSLRKGGGWEGGLKWKVLREGPEKTSAVRGARGGWESSSRGDR